MIRSPAPDFVFPRPRDIRHLVGDVGKSRKQEENRKPKATFIIGKASFLTVQDMKTKMEDVLKD